MSTTFRIPAPALAALCLAAELVLSAGARAQDDSAKLMAAEHAHDRPAATAAATTPPAREVSGENVVYGEAGGKKLNGYVARPKGVAGKLPGLIVIHEWWGLNDNIRDMARRLAGEGYEALAVDLYGGQTATDPEGAQKLMQARLDDIPGGQANLRQAYDFLEKRGAPRIGVIGWCFGGGWSLATAMMLPDKVDATVIYYGHLETDPEKLRPLGMPVIGFFGGKDKSIPPEKVKEFEAALKKLGKPVEVHVYPEADHAFANPSGGNYQPAAATDAWKRTVQFLAKHLKKA